MSVLDDVRWNSVARKSLVQGAVDEEVYGVAYQEKQAEWSSSAIENSVPGGT